MTDPSPSAHHKTAPLVDGEAINIGSGNHTFTEIPRAIWVGTAGNLAFVSLGGTAITLVGVPSGTLLPIRAQSITQAGTTASNMVAMW